MKQQNCIRLRPHHGLCLQFFCGQGYDLAFIQNMTAVLDQLHANSQQLIELTCQTDNLCIACPHNQIGVCRQAEKVALYDQKVLDLCQLTEGVPMTWRFFSEAVEQKILCCEKLSAVCGDCCWMQICSDAWKHKQKKVCDHKES